MAHCNLYSSCFFYNELITDMPHATEYMKDQYCHANYTNCTRFLISEKYGMDKVPTYIYPNDIFCAPNLNLPNGSGHEEGKDMMVSVIRPDGSSDKVQACIMGRMIELGGIAAYRYSDGWVEIRRKNSTAKYNGPERRVKIPFIRKKTG